MPYMVRQMIVCIYIELAAGPVSRQANACVRHTGIRT